jgi:N-acyl-D-aspartate/D-glutamate deacylase
VLDYVIRGGTVVDGSGRPSVVADVGIRDGRVAYVGRDTERSARSFDASGLMVAPGFIDPHTHYDAQLHWDGQATPSNWHGVTTVIGGNCGFTLAPLQAADVGYIRRMMARVEGMPMPALEAGTVWDWESFGDFLGKLDDRIAVNAGFLVGHSALRRYVMGEAAVEREADANEVAAMARLLEESIRAGGLGFSTSRSSTHSDGDGNPVPSRLASVAEVETLCAVLGRFEGTSIEAIVEGSIKGFTPEEIELLAGLSASSGAALNWNLMPISGRIESRVMHQLAPSRRARELGGRVLALSMPVNADMNMSLGTFSTWWHARGWEAILSLPTRERVAKLRDPEVRRQMVAAAEAPDAGAGATAANIGRYLIGETVSPANAGLEGLRVSDVAAERGLDDFECVVEISIADDFTTTFWPPPPGPDPEGDRLRSQLWRDPDVLLGGSDAGAHVDRMLGSSYPTRFLADSIRGRQLIPVEETVRQLTDVPARVFRLDRRGRLEPRWFADVVVFDPAVVDGGPPQRVFDFPGDSLRLVSASSGIVRVLVNGVETIADGEATGSLPGRVLRWGRDTEHGSPAWD